MNGFMNIGMTFQVFFTMETFSIPIRKWKSNDNRPPVHQLTIRIVREKKNRKMKVLTF